MAKNGYNPAYIHRFRRHNVIFFIIFIFKIKFLFIGSPSSNETSPDLSPEERDLSSSDTHSSETTSIITNSGYVTVANQQHPPNNQIKNSSPENIKNDKADTKTDTEYRPILKTNIYCLSQG